MLKPILSRASPGYLFFEAASLPRKDYWFCLALQHLIGWGFLLLSCVCAPRAWQEKTKASDIGATGFSQRWRFGGKRKRRALREGWLAANPVLWLVLRDRWLPRLVWTLTLIAFVVLGTILYVEGSFAPLQVVYYMQGLLSLGLTLWLASQACRFFVDAAGSGALELVLVAPVDPKQIVHSQWSALWRTFLVPALFVILLQIGGGIVAINEMAKSMAGVKAPPGFNFIHSQVASLIIGVVTFVGNMAAVGWFGMWMGLTTRKTSLAVLKTLAFVSVLPWLGLMFVQGMMMALFMFAKLPFWFGMVVVGGMSLGKDIFFIVWSRRRLLANFREAILGQSNTPAFPQAPPVIPVNETAAVAAPVVKS